VPRWLTPARGFVASFALLVALGTAALQLPGVTKSERELRWDEALFTSTSAVCVTGLVVRSPEDFTVAGQAVIMTLFQVGGLGVLTFGFFLVILVGRRMSFFGRALVQSTLAEGPWEDFWPLLRMAAGVTFLVEAIGASLLMLAWGPDMGWLRAFGWGAFHAVSAFCNAGFGLHPASLMPWRGNILVVATVAGLIIVGGLGFLPLTDIYDRWRSGRRRPLSLHTRLVLATTLALLIGGMIGVGVLEWHGALNGIPRDERAAAIAFQAVTPRTAGFSTLDYGRFSAAGLLFTVMLMFVGASPGSTGGGVKTTTLGVLVAAAVSRSRGHRRVNLWNRTLPTDALASAVALMLSSLALVLLATLIMLHLEAELGGPFGGAGSFLKVLFEAVSAFGTVGLSTGITAQLGVPSRLILVTLMFLGRVGPLTFGLALVDRDMPGDWQQPEESVMIG
jgi:trk/ktr system potassium uptake protein